MNHILKASLPSTHNYLKASSSSFPEMTMLCVFEQSGGRGQRGNSWESEPGKNLTFSLHYHPLGVPPISQFSISEATALAIVDTLEAFGITARVKWPNDIYVGDNKICGILIDHSLCGAEITDSIVSAGLNVNQTTFLSDAPNPTSMLLVSGGPFNLDDVRLKTGMALEHRLPLASSPEGRNRLHQEFMSRLWRFDNNLYPFRIVSSNSIRLARIKDVRLTGHIILQFDDNSESLFAFKEIEFLKSNTL